MKCAARHASADGRLAKGGRAELGSMGWDKSGENSREPANSAGNSWSSRRAYSQQEWLSAGVGR